MRFINVNVAWKIPHVIRTANIALQIKFFGTLLPESYHIVQLQKKMFQKNIASNNSNS